MMVGKISMYNSDTIEQIEALEKACFPAKWRFDREYIEELLKGKRNLHIVDTHDGIYRGCILCVPHNEAVKDLQGDADPLMKKNKNLYYIETIEILPSCRGKGIFAEMMYMLFQELNEIHITGVSMHARVKGTHLSEIIQAKYNVKVCRRIDKWMYYDYKEPCDYLEIQI